MSSDQHKYDVALSFAGEQREYVEAVYRHLKTLDIDVYYDRAEDINSWGKNLVDHFSEVFKDQARFCVMFISKDYAEKIWTGLERQITESRELIDDGYILPVRFDATPLKGLVTTKAYLNAVDHSPEELAEKIAKKVKNQNALPNKELPTITYKQPILRPAKFNVYKEREKWLDLVLSDLETRQVDERVDITIIRSGALGVRALVDGKLIYALNFNLGGMSSDDGISLSQSDNGNGLDNHSMSAYGSFDWDRKKNDTVFVMNDLSVFSNFGSNGEQRLTAAEFTEQLWSKIVEKIEEKYS